MNGGWETKSNEGNESEERKERVKKGGNKKPKPSLRHCVIPVTMNQIWIEGFFIFFLSFLFFSLFFPSFSLFSSLIFSSLVFLFFFIFTSFSSFYSSLLSNFLHSFSLRMLLHSFPLSSFFFFFFFPSFSASPLT